MKQEPSLIMNTDEIFENAYDIKSLSDVKNGGIISWHWPDPLGAGTVSRMKIREGISLGWGNFQVFEDIGIQESVAAGMTYTPLLFHFFPPCHGSYSFHFKESRYKPKLGESGFGSLLYPGRRLNGFYQFSKSSFSIGGIVLFVDPRLVAPLIADQHDRFPVGLCDIVQGNKDRFFNQVFALPPEALVSISQLTECPYSQGFRHFYFEAKALELVTCAIHLIATDTPCRPDSDALTPDDLVRVKKVRDILLDHGNVPPSLKALARLSGTNKDKLNRDFRKVFGTSVFDFFRITRLEKAKTLLENKRMSVTEVAFEVGYAHPQSFSRAFRQHFGTNPADYLQHRTFFT